MQAASVTGPMGDSHSGPPDLGIVLAAWAESILHWHLGLRQGTCGSGQETGTVIPTFPSSVHHDEVHSLFFSEAHPLAEASV